MLIYSSSFLFLEHWALYFDDQLSEKNDNKKFVTILNIYNINGIHSLWFICLGISLV